MNAFVLPIVLDKNKKATDKHIIADLSLQNSESLYNTILDTSNNIGKRTVNEWSKYYTTNTCFLKDTQRLLKRPIPTISWDTSDIMDVWNDINIFDSLNDNGSAFVSKYQYVEWEKLYALNTNSKFMQWMSLYNMSSPVFALLMPFFLCLLPFAILKAKHKNICFNNYLETLKNIFAKHQIGQLFALDSSATFDKKCYAAISAGFYILQIYQNIRACIQFWKNITHIQKTILIVNNHINKSLQVIKQYNSCCGDLKTQKLFVSNNNNHCINLENLQKELNFVSSKPFNLRDYHSIGQLMKCFYLIYQNKSYKFSLEFSFDFCGYIDNLTGIINNINSGFLGKTKYSKTKTIFKDAFYPVVKNPVKNSYNLNKHILVTGPNAAGKTTMLKTTIFNILLSQQIGYGCYKSAKINPYNELHCYINIPDTSGRDSLFQAEARRCKNILTSIENSESSSRHFCVFDELYSGTNPYEAIGSAVSFLKHLANNKNVSFIITTHFIGLCERLDKENHIKNCSMKTNGTDDNFKYTYKLSDGISKIKGGVKVLRDLNYPLNIIQETKNIINNLVI